MRKAPVLTLVFVLSALLFSVQAVQAGQTSPGLERQMATMTGSDEITVLVVLRDQADIKSLNDNLRLTRAPMDLRHRTVIGALKDVAQRSQGPILAEMANLKAADTIVGFKSYWLINAITVTTTVDGARQLALRDDVEVVEANMVIELIEPAFDLKEFAVAGENTVKLIGCQDLVLGKVNLAAAPDRGIDQAVDSLAAGVFVALLGMEFKIETVTVLGKRDQGVIRLVDAQDGRDRRAGRRLADSQQLDDRFPGTGSRKGELDRVAVRTADEVGRRYGETGFESESEK